MSIHDPSCIICKENIIGKYILCSNSSHLVGNRCLNDYLSKHVLPRTFELFDSCCIIKCPDAECCGHLDSVLIFSWALQPERKRYLSLIDETLSRFPPPKRHSVLELHTSLIDLLTLKCPSCFATVDPEPDGCSAVRCLSCGNWYYLYLFDNSNFNSFIYDVKIKVLQLLLSRLRRYRCRYESRKCAPTCCKASS